LFTTVLAVTVQSSTTVFAKITTKIFQFQLLNTAFVHLWKHRFLTCHLHILRSLMLALSLRLFFAFIHFNHKFHGQPRAHPQH